jgi:hypothetical protein
MHSLISVVNEVKGRKEMTTNGSCVICETDTEYVAIDKLGDNCIVFEKFTASIGDLMIAN